MTPATTSTDAQSQLFPDDGERRTLVRYASLARGACGDAGIGAQPSWTARARDISTNGASLLVRRPFRKGAELVIRLEGKDDAGSILRQARIVHTRACPPHGWVLGCAFEVPLTEEELRALLA